MDIIRTLQTITNRKMGYAPPTFSSVWNAWDDEEDWDLPNSDDVYDDYSDEYGDSYTESDPAETTVIVDGMPMPGGVNKKREERDFHTRESNKKYLENLELERQQIFGWLLTHNQYLQSLVDQISADSTYEELHNLIDPTMIPADKQRVISINGLTPESALLFLRLLKDYRDEYAEQGISTVVAPPAATMAKVNADWGINTKVSGDNRKDKQNNSYRYFQIKKAWEDSGGNPADFDANFDLFTEQPQVKLALRNLSNVIDRSNLQVFSSKVLPIIPLMQKAKDSMLQQRRAFYGDDAANRMDNADKLKQLCSIAPNGSPTLYKSAELFASKYGGEVTDYIAPVQIFDPRISMMVADNTEAGRKILADAKAQGRKRVQWEDHLNALMSTNDDPVEVNEMGQKVLRGGNKVIRDFEKFAELDPNCIYIMPSQINTVRVATAVRDYLKREKDLAKKGDMLYSMYANPNETFEDFSERYKTGNVDFRGWRQGKI